MKPGVKKLKQLETQLKRARTKKAIDRNKSRVLATAPDVQEMRKTGIKMRGGQEVPLLFCSSVAITVQKSFDLTNSSTVFDQKTKWCSGTLISDTVVLTAAHRVYALQLASSKDRFVQWERLAMEPTPGMPPSKIVGSKTRCYDGNGSGSLHTSPLGSGEFVLISL